METIEDLICSEFIKAGYSAIGKLADSPIFGNNDNSDFWLLLSDYDIDVEYQQKLADNYGKLTDEYIAAAKNTSVLVLKKVEHIDDDKKSWAVGVENDKFYFKKYVLLYTEVAFDKLKNEVVVDMGKSLSSCLADTKVFKKLKADTQEGAYTLLYGIAHKLPFLLVEMQKSNLELAYPTSWSSPSVHETNDWVNRIPDENQEIEEYLDEILNSVGNE